MRHLGWQVAVYQAVAWLNDLILTISGSEVGKFK